MVRCWTIVVALAAVSLSVLACAESATSARATSALSLRIAVPERGVAFMHGDLPMLRVILENNSADEQRIIDEWNSFGYFNLTLDYTLPDGTHKSMTKVTREWTRNFLTATPLAPGECMIRDVYFDPKVWSGLPELCGEITFSANFSQDEKSPAIWNGAVKSPPVKVSLRFHPFDNSR